ncbi:MAG: hypothetical protein DMG96_01555 [Acidobacteria bacterium]|nr:MAG: hypothetical protein DMG96_01555 [Acidobacteriota bacterium]
MEVDRDRAEIVATVIRFWQAYERKDLAALSNMLTAADDFTFFGSDAAEVVKTRREWEELMQTIGSCLKRQSLASQEISQFKSVRTNN